MLSSAEGHLALDRPLEQLIARILEREPAERGEPVDGNAVRRACHPAGRRPVVGRSRPLSSFASVVLPDPFGPTMATPSPGSTSSDTSRSACTPLG